MYPVMLNISGKKCIVVGGGAVALRKAKKLIESGGSVTVISKEFIDGFECADMIRAEYEISFLEGAFLVTAATDDRELNRRIAMDARSLGILVYASDDALSSDFILPAVAEAGDVVVTASTNGKYPFLAKRLRDEISENIEFYNSILPTLEKYRKIIIKEYDTGRRDILKTLVSDEMIKLAKKDLKNFEKEIQKRIEVRKTE